MSEPKKPSLLSELSEHRLYARNLELLCQASRQITTTNETGELYRIIVTNFRDILGLDFATLMLLAEEGSKLTIVDTLGFPASMIGTFSLAEGEGLSTFVVREGRPVTVIDFTTESRFAVPQVVFEHGILSAICVPMLVNEEVFGVLIGHTKEKRVFTESEITLFSSFANQAAMAIRNSQAMTALTESEARFRDLFENSSDLIQSVATNGRILYVNRTWLDTLGYTAEEAVGLSIFDVIHPEHRAHCQAVFQQIIEGGSNAKLETIFLTKDGQEIMLEGSVNCRFLEGRPVSTRGIFRNITARKEMDKEMHQAAKLESVGVLAGGLAHDFNNLLTVILGNISLANSGAEISGFTRECLDEAEEAAARAQEIVRQLLTFARSGEPVKRLTRIDAMLREATAFALSGSNVRPFFDIVEDLWPVQVDEGQLHQVINNLVLNARDVMRDGGEVRVAAENLSLDEIAGLDLRPGPYVLISVIDHGSGIPAELLPKIFDPYFTTKQMDRSKGSGLGLAVCYSIIRSHGGGITVESAKGEGSRFKIYLPALPSVPSQTVKTSVVEETGHRGKILVMDDEKQIRQLASRMLDRLGYRVEFVRDGAEALTRYEQAMAGGQPFDAVILDLTIAGGMGGRETVARLRKIDPEVRAIVSSGYDEDPIMADYAAHGFRAAIPKPYRLQDVEKILQQVISSARSV